LEYFDRLHREGIFTREELISRNFYIVGIQTSQVRVTVCVIVTAIRYINDMAASKRRSIGKVAINRLGRIYQ
jgi:hypothetical protein